MMRGFLHAHITACFFLWATTTAFLQPLNRSTSRTVILSSSSESTTTAERTKQDLLDACRSSTPSASLIQLLVNQLTASSDTKAPLWLSGTWELLYTPDDVTRSSPFFTAFRQAVAQADQIFDITDAIPAPLKELGPATQEIDLEAKRMVSRVKVATLGGQATSIMTTRCTIASPNNNIRGDDEGSSMILQVDSTKPEDSTIVNKLFGQFAESINANTPAFPSGTALERLQTGSSRVVWKNLYCDEGLRISRYGDEENFCVWTRKEFATYPEI